MVKKCELCKVPATIFCDSDQASLCWDCDAKVHGANFLVARHSRTLLCRSCRSPTPWKASGTTLCHTVSICPRCCDAGANGQEEKEDGEGGNDEEIDAEEDDVDGEVTGDKDEDIQVVPWSSTPPPPASSPSISSESSSISGCRNGNSDGDFTVVEMTTLSLKRQWEDQASDRHHRQEGENEGWVGSRDGGTGSGKRRWERTAVKGVIKAMEKVT